MQKATTWGELKDTLNKAMAQTLTAEQEKELKRLHINQATRLLQLQETDVANVRPTEDIVGHGPATVASDQHIRAGELDSARSEHDLTHVLESFRDSTTYAEYNLLIEQAAQLSDSMRS